MNILWQYEKSLFPSKAIMCSPHKREMKKLAAVAAIEREEKQFLTDDMMDE